jgi:tetratricopeptide (TPR) repeat protein
VIEMQFDVNNKIVRLCSQGMILEGEGKPEEALKLFQQAWDDATDDFEKFTSAHYVARHQKTIADKLKWDETALGLALKLGDPTVKGTYPSLYLNIAKCHEDLHDFDNAIENYQLGLSFIDQLPDDGYANMIKGGIIGGIERIKGQKIELSS